MNSAGVSVVRYAGGLGSIKRWSRSGGWVRLLLWSPRANPLLFALVGLTLLVAAATAALGVAQRSDPVAALRTEWSRTVRW